MNFLRTNTFLTLSEIAEKFDMLTKDGVGDHSVVSYGIKKHKLFEKDEVYKEHIEFIHNRLLGVAPKYSELDMTTLMNSVLNCDNYWQMKKLQLQLLEVKEIKAINTK